MRLENIGAFIVLAFFAVFITLWCGCDSEHIDDDVAEVQARLLAQTKEAEAKLNVRYSPPNFKVSISMTAGDTEVNGADDGPISPQLTSIDQVGWELVQTGTNPENVGDFGPSCCGCSLTLTVTATPASQNFQLTPAGENLGVTLQDVCNAFPWLCQEAILTSSCGAIPSMAPTMTDVTLQWIVYNVLLDGVVVATIEGITSFTYGCSYEPCHDQGAI
jgi:hypothetical protein